MAEITAVLLNFLKAIGKYRWYAVVIAWTVALIGWAVVLRLPPQYEASARVYVDTQSMLRPLLSGMTSMPDVNQQVMFMRRTLLSRPNIERLMRDVDLDVKAKNTKEHDRIVNELMSNLRLGGTERDDIYTISYVSDNPQLGKAVVQGLLTIFVEGSFGGKKQDSDKAIQFIDEQIKTYEDKLAAAENSLKEFKIKNMGMLPGSGDFNGQLSTVTDQLNQARLELAEAEQARNAIRRQINGEPAQPGTKTIDPALLDPELEGRIQTVQKNLDSLRLQYTEQHPDVVANKRLLEQLLAQKADLSKTKKRSSDPGAGYSPMLQQLTVALSAAEARVASMRARVDEFSARMARLRAQSTTAPEIEVQLTQLNRDYDVNKANYQRLVERREQARLSGDLTSATDMLAFRIIDPPTVPNQPSGPNRLRLFSMVFGGALVAGLAVAFLMSQFRPTFMSQTALRDTTGLPVLGSIGMNWTNEQTVRRKRRLVAVGVSVLLLLGAYAAGVAAILVRPTL
ncbi:XrtA system polysaccharide chain length determinant [Herbaspirillum sp. SJZ107]|uniref:XrtA system polysaccharide chain length determinant n=1 Tax=Herbaspirillum sp. SJZ107 TaxID=2572881 RepID=UPI00114E3625|nr:XrtA system polysaccharide chain length determinant [Herbaspirillum sp. SJZ107]TQK05229.1 polysaccharide chain length determinant protein (PEP-CTERM system associated) [Herbaspirillum sp. SJZ107]